MEESCASKANQTEEKGLKAKKLFPLLTAVILHPRTAGKLRRGRATVTKYL